MKERVWLTDRAGTPHVLLLVGWIRNLRKKEYKFNEEEEETIEIFPHMDFIWSKGRLWWIGKLHGKRKKKIIMNVLRENFLLNMVKWRICWHCVLQFLGFHKFFCWREEKQCSVYILMMSENVIALCIFFWTCYCLGQVRIMKHKPNIIRQLISKKYYLLTFTSFFFKCILILKEKRDLLVFLFYLSFFVYLVFPHFTLIV